MKKNTFLSLITSIFFAVSFLAQTTYYVKSGGNNAGGLDEANAFSTVNNARAAASNGDNIIIIGAITQTGQVLLDKSLNFQGQDSAIINGVDNDVDTPSNRLFLVSAAGLTITFNDITFQGSKNKGFNGSVVSLEAASTLAFTDCIFDNNSTKGAFQGGVIYATNGTMTFTTSVFKNNTSGRSGGAIYVNAALNPTVNITGCTFYNNLAQGVGGSDGGAAILSEGVSVTFPGQVIITNSTFFQNYTTKNFVDYGAIRSTNTNISVTNSLFYNNKINGGVGVSSDFGSSPGGVQSFTNSIGQAVRPNVDTRVGSNDTADLINSNLVWNGTLNKVTFTAPSLLTDSTPIDFGTDNSDVGAWDSKINLFKGTTNSDWATGANWSSNAAPTSLENVTLLSDSPDLVIGSSTNSTINNLSVNAASSLTINSGGVLIVNGTSSGNVTYKRNLPTTNWYLVSAPLNGEDMTDMRANNSFATGTGANIGFAPYTTDGNSWSYFSTSSTDALIAGIGYSAKLASAGDLSFTGTINTADVSVAVANTGTGFNLIGNPFTSHLNSATFLTDNSANLVSQTLWVWDGSTYDTKVTGESFVLAPTQGFFVRSLNGTNINISESYQTTTGGTFQKSSKTEVKLLMNDGTTNRFAKMYYLDNATKGFDNGFDGETFGGIENTVDVFTNLLENNEGKKFQVQSLPVSEMETMIVPVGVKAAAGKEITFTSEAINLPGDVKVFLEDRETNTITRLDEANASYKVTLNDALNGTGRFFLHTKSSAVLSTDDVVLQNTSIYAINNNTLRVVGLPSGNANVKMYSILGKQVMSTSFSSTGVKDISLPKLSTGMYIIQLETATGKLNKKIVLE
jgi:predicted outer membrane repeat protein